MGPGPRVGANSDAGRLPPTRLRQPIRRLHKTHAILYVTSADLLLEFVDNRAFEFIELLAGGIPDTMRLKIDLADKDPAIIVQFIKTTLRFKVVGGEPMPGSKSL